MTKGGVTQGWVAPTRTLAAPCAEGAGGTTVLVARGRRGARGGTASRDGGAGTHLRGAGGGGVRPPLGERRALEPDALDGRLPLQLPRQPADGVATAGAAGGGGLLRADVLRRGAGRRDLRPLRPAADDPGPAFDSHPDRHADGRRGA